MDFLLGRPPHPFPPAPSWSDRSLFVTGAAGSIGRGIALAALRGGATVWALDRDETGLVRLERALGQRLRQSGRLRLLFDDVRDSDRLADHLRYACPDCVIHAAAAKHLVLLESHPLQGLDQNVRGTQSLLRATQLTGAPPPLLLSTDKAAGPTGVLGASKRWAERVVRQADGRVLRLANVLGTRGSVLERWRDQLCDGQPLSVAEPRVTRILMSADEASSFALHAARVLPPGALGVPRDLSEMSVHKLALRFLQRSGSEGYPLQEHALHPAERERETLLEEAEAALAIPLDEHLLLLEAEDDLPRFEAGDERELRAILAGRDEVAARAFLARAACPSEVDEELPRSAP